MVGAAVVGAAVVAAAVVGADVVGAVVGAVVVGAGRNKSLITIAVYAKRLELLITSTWFSFNMHAN